MKFSEISDWLLPAISAAGGWFGSMIQRHVVERRSRKAEIKTAEVDAEVSREKFFTSALDTTQTMALSYINRIKALENEVIEVFAEKGDLQAQLLQLTTSVRRRIYGLEFIEEDGMRISPVIFGSGKWEEVKGVPGMYMFPIHFDVYTSGTATRIKTDRPVRMKRHRHKQAEGVLMLSGIMIDRESGKVVKANEYIFFGEMEWHDPDFPGPAAFILFWTPPLDKLPHE